MEIKNIVLIVIFIFGLAYMQYIRTHTVDEIISKYAQARGGKEKLRTITSVCMKGSRKMLGNEVNIKITRVQGKLYRNDFTVGTVSGYTIVTPTAGWAFVPMRSQKREAIPAETLQAMQTEMDIAGGLIDYAAKGNRAELAGKETVNGREAFKINLTLSSGKEITYFIDTNDYLLLQTKEMRMSTDGAGHEKELITNYDDYRPVDGIMFPHTISNPGNELASGTVVFEKIELNRPVDETLYEPLM